MCRAIRSVKFILLELDLIMLMSQNTSSVMQSEVCLQKCEIASARYSTVCNNQNQGNCMPSKTLSKQTTTHITWLGVVYKSTGLR